MAFLSVISQTLRSDFISYIYSWHSSVAQRHGVGHVSPVDESVLLILQWCFRHIRHIPYTALITDNSNHQPLSSTRQGGYIYLVTMYNPTQHRTTHVLSECPSTISRWNGDACEVVQDEPGFEQRNTASSSTS